MYSLGIDIGYSSLKVVLLDTSSEIKYFKYLVHKGRVKVTLKNAINDLLRNYNFHNIKYGAVTGRESKFLTKNEGKVHK
ncbi:hypothetical protein GM661_13140 [Iocasia frigidifontis]|uniref:Uncharacterized protein n=1 Tax=Iocasia fonsfrigidae TaxID=2682810 RepID=A0A8A7KGJ0_9FIRM|nr:hypothetical protein [Iocasia fonsfrigidae]QTL98838.1 hypothetical protein GM661_13140 [Iocasia fonsfrigidae]